MSGSELMARATVEEIVAHRDRAIELHARAWEAIKAAHEAREEAWAALQVACAGLGEGYRSFVDTHRPEIEAFEAALGPLPDAHQYADAARRLTDTRVWASLVERTGLEAYMDHEAKEELRRQMGGPRDEPRWRRALSRGDEESTELPHVTAETIYATLEKFREESGTIFRRGLANAFAKLDRRFRSHDGFGIGARVIFERAFDEWGTWNHYRGTRDTLIDVERVFLVLDGKDPAAPYGGIVGKIDEDRRKERGFGRRQGEHEGDYFKVRTFKNGNVHLWFTRPDLVEEANKLLAEYYGAGLGWGRGGVEEDPEAPLQDRAIGHARNLGFFPTPEGVVDYVINFAHYEGLEVLEPSAGVGALAFAAAQRGGIVDAIEIDAQRAQELYAHPSRCLRSVRQANFLDLKPVPRYDRVLMNPPFDRGRDVDHVWHAWKWLKPGGRLVAIMSASTEFRSDKKAAAFRRAMNAAGAKWWDLPAGSFAPATNVNTLCLVVDKPKEN